VSAVLDSAAREARARPARLAVSGVANLRSVGIARYARLLADALANEEIGYSLVDRPEPGDLSHFHLANSSRALLRRRRRPGAPFAVTVHDVVPRTPALRPLYRALAYPQVARHATLAIVHTRLAADMLIREAGRPRRLEVIPHPAARPRETDRGRARRELGWPEDRLIAVLPGAIRAVKLVAEALEAADGAHGWRVALAGRLRDRRLARAAAEHGALTLPDPDECDYERAIVAADVVLCLRSGSVGETNGPFLDALGAGRAVLATPTGSIPEVAGDAVRFCAGTAASIRTGLAELTDAGARVQLERLATARAATLTWSSSARAHAALFREVLDG
jgi:glycosyltransferase involved in cell wall biosynthesis